MRVKFLLNLVLILSLSLILVLAACGGGDDDDSDTVSVGDTDTGDTGIVKIGVTDKPDKNITGIEVTTDLIQASVEASEGPAELDENSVVQEDESDGAEWQTLLDGETSFDLIEVAGIEDILGEAELSEGTYNQIRLQVVSVVVTLNGEEIEAKVPSGTIKLVRPFEVKAGETTIVTFDFNAEKSVVVTGADTVLFKPVVKLLVRYEDEPFVPAPTEDVSPTGESDATPTQTPTQTPTEEEPVAEFEPMIQTNADGSFFLEITSPEEPEVFADTQTITVAGKTTVDAAVSVGDSFIDVELDGSFETTVSLEDDITIIDVVASISTGEEFSQVITVIYAPEE